MTGAEPAAPKISAVLISLDAQAHLRECLAALAWCDEVIVLDSGSTDATAAICAEFGVRFSTSPDWPGFGPQKNRAVALARNDWIFSIDTDEICTPALCAQLQAAARSAIQSAYEMPRRSSFCGHFMRHGGWWPDYVTRLFRRGAARFSDSLVHERVIVEGPIGRLTEPLVHYTYDTMEQALAKAERYASVGAQQAYAAGKRAGPLTPALRGAWTFIRTYVIRLGFLDGQAGLMLARYNAHTTRLRYRKLRQLALAR
ncbi:MAG TPA: glycosyltransferase family 2 protein [Verrucomicrobiae bacterium]|nr:glycosyltransferase family 2 protein [Verrucomicrobiae bacterium]